MATQALPGEGKLKRASETSICRSLILGKEGIPSMLLHFTHECPVIPVSWWNKNHTFGPLASLPALGLSEIYL